MTKAVEVSIEQLRRSLGDVVKRVAYSGEEFVILFHGRPVAQLRPLDAPSVPKAKKTSKPSRA